MESESRSLCLTLCDPTDYTIHGTLQARYWSGQPFPSPGDLPNPGIEPRSLKLQVDCLPAEPQGKPKNYRVGSLSLLQQIFLTQESNQGFLHYRWILYQQSYQESPWHLIGTQQMSVERRKGERELKRKGGRKRGRKEKRAIFQVFQAIKNELYFPSNFLKLYCQTTKTVN